MASRSAGGRVPDSRRLNRPRRKHICFCCNRVSFSFFRAHNKTVFSVGSGRNWWSRVNAPWPRVVSRRFVCVLGRARAQQVTRHCILSLAKITGCLVGRVVFLAATHPRFRPSRPEALSRCNCQVPIDVNLLQRFKVKAGPCDGYWIFFRFDVVTYALRSEYLLLMKISLIPPTLNVLRSLGSGGNLAEVCLQK